MNLKMCLNWKVLGTLGVVALGVLVFAPHLLTAALPLLLFAACPLSMILMMGGMSKMGGKRDSQPALTGEVENGASLPRAEQLRQLRSELADLNARRSALEAYIRALEANEPEQLPAPRPAAGALPTASTRYAEADPAS